MLRIQKYECGLHKSSKSSNAKVAEGKVIKSRHSSIRHRDLCHVQTKVSKQKGGSAGTIEQLNQHTHMYVLVVIGCGSRHTPREMICVEMFANFTNFANGGKTFLVLS